MPRRADRSLKRCRVFGSKNESEEQRDLSRMGGAGCCTTQSRPSLSTGGAPEHQGLRFGGACLPACLNA